MKTKTTYRTIIALAIKLLLILCVVFGVWYAARPGSFMYGSAILYYTVQSNIWIAIVTALFAGAELSAWRHGRPRKIPQWLYAVKFIFTVAITLTGLVFFVILVPYLFVIGYGSFAITWGNILGHGVVPILALVDWFMFDLDYRTGRHTFWLGLITPLYYMFFVAVCIAKNITFSGSLVPYYYLNYQLYGWFRIGNGSVGVVYWIIFQALLILGISRLLLWGKDKLAARAQAKASE